MLGRITALAALLLAVASADVAAYAERLPATGDILSLPKNALPARASATVSASSAKPAASAECIKENWHPPLKWPSGFCVYAYANPTVWWDPDGRQSIDINVVSCSEDGSCTPTAVSGAALNFLKPSQMATQAQADALIEAQARSILFAGGRTDDPMVVAPLLTTRAGRFERPFVDYGASRTLSAMQSSADLDRALGIDSGFAPVGTATGQLGVAAWMSLPPVAYMDALHQIANAENGFDTSVGVVQAGLAMTPLAFMRGASPWPTRPAFVTEDGTSAAVRFERQMALIADSDFGPLNQPQLAQVRVNQRQGARRELETLADLQAQYPSAQIQQQVYLRTQDGRRAIDPLTNEGRRLDFVVIEGGEVIDVVETTSQTARKAAQREKELRIRSEGGTYVRDRNERCLLNLCDRPTREDRRQ